MMKLFMYIFMLIFPLYLMNKLFLITYMYMWMLINFLLMLFYLNFSCDYFSLIYSWMGFDLLSFSMIFLTFWIILLMYMVSFKVNNKTFFSFILLLLMLFLLLAFSSMNYFLFYIFFEMSMIPTFILIVGWGYQPERLKASMYMLMYTMFFSLPLMILLFYLNNLIMSMHYDFLFINNVKFMNIEIFYNYMLLAFLVKMPLFMLHFWLPKAHVEAPISGSMILAGVMLKLGGYGIFRSSLIMLKLSNFFSMNYIMISLLGLCIVSMICLVQYDMKLLVAYSSVVHMGMMLMGVLTMKNTGILGSYMMMIAHGFCSPAMFVMVNYFYERSSSRSMLINKGLNYFYPSMMLWWFLVCMSNMSAPISLNLFSELYICISLMSWSSMILLILGFGMFLSALYSLYLFSIVYHGVGSPILKFLFPMKTSEYLIIMMHWIPLNFLILFIDFFF